MTTETRALVLDLVESVAHRQRPYAQVMEEWLGAFPSVSVFEEAIHQSLIVCTHEKDRGWIVRATPLGRSLLKKEGRLPEIIASPHIRSDQVRIPATH